MSYFFDGSGYAVARNIERRGRFSQVTRFDIEVRTPTDNGLILLMVNGVSTKFCWYPLAMSTISSPVVTTSCEIPNICVLMFNFWKEEIRCVHLVYICIRRRAGFCSNPEASGASGWLYCYGDTLRETAVKTSIASLFKCECTAKYIGNFCEIAPIKQ